ncbi:rRNA methyltransferase 3, mitochondrial [Pelobates cultripes]|uniref:rRNA methyltransferase 3, mitochondrial n=1 Tax=Pelobates cultripes TaxID=61616 RepID=A0AAD1R426_PELCU|nr:rRNA methyltransferase 3, mitochondrial [Pelobates cultripes]
MAASCSPVTLNVSACELPAVMAALMRGVLRCAGLTQVRCSGNIQVKRYVRALRRTPVRVIPPGGSTGDGQSVPRVTETREERVAPQVISDQNAQPVTRYSARGKSKAEEKHETSLELQYEKAAPGDKRLSKLVTIAKSKKFRDRHGQVLLEGRKLLVDALEAGALLKTLFFSRVEYLKELPSDKLKQAKLIKVKFEDVKTWSDVMSPQGIIGIFLKPDHAKMNYPVSHLKYSIPLSLICDNIRDPGNLGTILRCAAGAGCNKVLLTKGCVDAWEPKVLRSGMGAHFRIPIVNDLDWDTVPNYLSHDTRVFVADNFRPLECNEEGNKKAGDYGWVSTNPRRIYGREEDADASDSDESSDDEEHYIPDIQVQSYDEQWTTQSSALVIGGETHGLSLESLLLAEKTGGRRIFIPVVPGIDSLNSAMAASIILFEGRRQLQSRNTRLKKQVPT